MQQIRIETTRAQLEISTTSARMAISNNRPTVRIETNIPKPQIETEVPKFKADWDRVRAESGMKSPDLMAKDMVELGKQAALKFTAQSAQEGNMMADPKLGERAIPTIAAQRNELKLPEVNLGAIPKKPVEIEWSKGVLSVNWSQKALEMNWEGDYQPTIEVEPYAVEIKLSTMPSIRIFFDENNIPTGVGRTVDTDI